jgi:RNase adapter protein RapZ
LESHEEALVRRFHETRRRHPLGDESRSVLEAIRAERKAMAHLREIADRIIDTSGLTVHQLKARLAELYVVPAARTGLATSLVSFGFKHGLPVDADLVFDVRFLPNPHFVDALRPLDGRDERVRRFVVEQAATVGFMARLKSLLEFLLPSYQGEGKAYLTIAIGCTGGRHRSVALVEELRRVLGELGFEATVTHRDLERE